MKISAKARYGLRSMIDLAVNSQREHVSLFSISDRQVVSENYLEQIFSALRKAGLVKSVKGASGGYILSRPPREILVGEILRPLEGSLSVVDEEEQESPLQRCIRTLVWEKINGKIDELADSLTLQDLVDDYFKSNSNYYMYYI